MSKPENATGHMSPELICSANPLTAEQIENWRKVLCGMIGPYALLMPDAEVQKMRDTLQSRVDNMPNGEITCER